MRETCPRCRRPAAHCLCALVPPMACRVKLVVLMHPHEAKHVKANTRRLAALSFEDAEILVGVGFDGDARLRELLADPGFFPMLLYPGEGARNLSEGALTPEELDGRRLLVILLDATWPLARKMLRLSPALQSLPRLMFSPRERSRWVIKRQPHELCLSTLEAVHELMTALEAAGLDRYERPGQLLAAFEAMQALQVARAADPASSGYRRNPERARSVREAFASGRSAEIRPKSRGLFFKDPHKEGTMNYNDILKRVRYALRLSDADMLELLALGGRPAEKSALDAWFRKEEEPGFAECDMASLTALLDGLVVKRRGPRETGSDAASAAPRVELLDNNLVLKKLRVALELREDDLMAIMKLSGVAVSKGELSALFRRKDQKNYKPCLDQFLRAFLAGLAAFRKG